MPVKTKQRTDNRYKYISIIFGLAILGLLAYIYYPYFVVQKLVPLNLPELSTDGYTKVENVDVTAVNDSLALITLNAGCYDLEASVETTQALSIEYALQNITGPRPNAHDLAKDIFNSLNIQVLLVKITNASNQLYHSRIFLRQGNTVLNLDARPSDAIAIALRVNAPIYINTTLLKENGRYIC